MAHDHDPAEADADAEAPVEILDGLQNLEILGRRMSRRVLQESGAVWAGIWDEVIRIQETNPDVRRLAEGKTDDPEQAIVELVPQLMLLNPQICRGVAAFCHGVVAELGFLDDEAVTPSRDDPTGTEHQFGDDGEHDVERESVGGQQQQDRLAALKEQADRIEEKLTRALRLLGDREADRPGPRGDPAGT